MGDDAALTAVFQERHGRLAHRLPIRLHAAASVSRMDPDSKTGAIAHACEQNVRVSGNPKR